MNTLQSWLNTIFAAVGPIIILWKLGQGQLEAMRAAARAEAAATAAAMNARQAVVHASEAVDVVTAMAADIKEVVSNTTNGSNTNSNGHV
jgi:hypothetical protein